MQTLHQGGDTLVLGYGPAEDVQYMTDQYGWCTAKDVLYGEEAHSRGAVGRPGGDFPQSPSHRWRLTGAGMDTRPAAHQAYQLQHFTSSLL